MKKLKKNLIGFIVLLALLEGSMYLKELITYNKYLYCTDTRYGYVIAKMDDLLHFSRIHD